jgi:hypothetical protein
MKTKIETHWSDKSVRGHATLLNSPSPIADLVLSRRASSHRVCSMCQGLESSNRGRRPPRHDHATPSDFNGILFRLAGSWVHSSRWRGGGRLKKPAPSTERSATADSRGVDKKASRPSSWATRRSHAAGLLFAWTALLLTQEAAKGRKAVPSVRAHLQGPGLARSLLCYTRNPKKRPS